MEVLGILKDAYFRITNNGPDYARYEGVTISSNCRILTTTFGSEPWLISSGNVKVASGIRLLTHDGSTWRMRDEKGRRFLFGRIKIGNTVFIGVNSIIMPGIKIDNNVIIAAGSVLTKSVPSGKILAGNPAKIIGDFYSYRDKVLTNYMSDVDFISDEKYRVRTEKVASNEFKQFLS